MKLDPSRLRGMASDPRNVADMKLLVGAAQAIEDLAEAVRLLRWSVQTLRPCHTDVTVGCPLCDVRAFLAKHPETP